jgi:Cu2+-exporting ATPase
MEMQSEHPLAAAVVKYLSENGIQPLPADELQQVTGITGKGIRAVRNGITYLAAMPGQSSPIPPIVQ